MVGQEQVRAGFQARFDGIADVHYGDARHWACGERAASEWERYLGIAGALTTCLQRGEARPSPAGATA